MTTNIEKLAKVRQQCGLLRLPTAGVSAKEATRYCWQKMRPIHILKSVSLWFGFVHYHIATRVDIDLDQIQGMRQSARFPLDAAQQYLKTNNKRLAEFPYLVHKLHVNDAITRTECISPDQG